MRRFRRGLFHAWLVNLSVKFCLAYDNGTCQTRVQNQPVTHADKFPRQLDGMPRLTPLKRPSFANSLYPPVFNLGLQFPTHLLFQQNTIPNFQNYP